MMKISFCLGLAIGLVLGAGGLYLLLRLALLAR